MNLLDSNRDLVDLRPGLILGEPESPSSESEEVRTDIAAFVRVRRSEELIEPEEIDPEAPYKQNRLFIRDLPGSTQGEYCGYRIEHHQLSGWDERPFQGEFRTRHPALTRMFFENGGRQIHLVDLHFYVPPFDPSLLAEDEDPDLIAELREEAAYLQFHSWALERLDDFGYGEINQIALPELWTAQVHLLPQVWALVSSFCRRTGNRFFVADCAPPFKLLQAEERKRAKAEGYEITAEELQPAALAPWFRAKRWATSDDVPTEVALTLDALAETREILRRSEITLSCLGVYWPWLTNIRGMAIPPCGAVCGVYARSDDENGPIGVMKPPANESVKGVVDLALHIDERPSNMLQREGVNLLHTRVGRGIVVWGARTLCTDDLWRFVNVRRLIGYIGKQIELDNQWAVFENNDPDLRQRVSRDVRYFLTDLWEKGALQGETADQAFRVVCDDQNNPDWIKDQGMLVVDVWVNPIQTNEFVHLKLTYGDALLE